MKRYTPEELQTVLAEHKLWRESCGNEGARADLTGANLRSADLRGANLRGANLTDTNLTGAYLTGANLRSADLRGANLTDTNLTGANLTGANLTGAYLRGAYLRGDFKIQKTAVIAGLYTYLAMPIIAEDGTEWVRLGCHTRTIADWEADFWNNPDEFPNDGSTKSRERELAYKTCLAWLEIHREPK